MQDIGVALNQIMLDKQCSPVYAFFLLSANQREGSTDGIHKLQSESKKEIGRRLRDTCNF